MEEVRIPYHRGRIGRLVALFAVLEVVGAWMIWLIASRLADTGTGIVALVVFVPLFGVCGFYSFMYARALFGSRPGLVIDEVGLLDAFPERFAPRRFAWDEIAALRWWRLKKGRIGTKTKLVVSLGGTSPGQHAIQPLSAGWFGAERGTIEEAIERLSGGRVRISE